jgi:hypothetical protein
MPYSRCMTPNVPGKYFFTDAIGAPPQGVEVIEVNGVLCAAFPDEESGGRAIVPVEDMAGTWRAASKR